MLKSIWQHLQGALWTIASNGSLNAARDTADDGYGPSNPQSASPDAGSDLGSLSTVAANILGTTADAATSDQASDIIVVPAGQTLTIGGNHQVGPYGTEEGDGPGTLHTTGIITLDEPVYMGGGLNWINSGTVDENSTLYGGDAAGPLATFTNAAGATFAFTNDFENIDNNGGATGYLTVVNHGTITKTGGTGGSTIDVALNNVTGAVISSDSGTLYLQGGGSFAGSIDGTGTVDFDGGTSVVATTLTATKSFNQTGGTIVVESGATLSLAGAQFGPFGTGDIDGAGTLHTTNVITMDESVYIGGGLNWINSGTVDENSTLYGGDASGGIATFTNAAGATFAFTNDFENIDNNGGAQGHLTVVNDGTITKTGGTGGSTVDVALNNAAGAVISSDSGTLYLQGGGSFAGSIGGTGTVDFDGGTSVVATTLTAGSAFNQTGGVIVVDSGATLSVAGAQFGPFGTGDIDGAGALRTTGVITLDEYVYIGGGLNWTNSGTIDENSTLFGGDASGGIATFTNATGATFDFTNDFENIDNNGGASGYLTVVNDGTITKTGGTGGSTIDVALQNTAGAVISSDSGTLYLQGGGSFAGSIGGTGTVDFDGGTSVVGTTLTATRSFNQTGGTIVVESGATLSLAGAQFGPFGTGDINGIGTLHTTGVTTLDEYVYVGGGLNWTNSGTIDENSTLFGGDASGGIATFTNAAGATFDFTNDFENIDNNGGALGYLTVVNHGTITKTGGTGSSTIDVALNNTGTVESQSGTLILAGPVTNTGTIGSGVDSGVDISGVLVGSGTLTVDSGGTIEIGGATTESANFTGAGLLRLDLPSSYTGKIGGLTPGAQIALGGTQATGFSLHGSVLTVELAGGGSYSLSGSGLGSNDTLSLANNVLTVGTTGGRPDNDHRATRSSGGESLTPRSDDTISAGSGSAAAGSLLFIGHGDLGRLVADMGSVLAGGSPTVRAVFPAGSGNSTLRGDAVPGGAGGDHAVSHVSGSSLHETLGMTLRDLVAADLVPPVVRFELDRASTIGYSAGAITSPASPHGLPGLPYDSPIALSHVAHIGGAGIL